MPDIYEHRTHPEASSPLLTQRRRLIGAALEKINPHGVYHAKALIRDPELARPDLVYDSLDQVSIDDLLRLGIRAAIFDLDGTLRDEGASELHPRIAPWFTELQGVMPVAGLTNKVAPCNRELASSSRLHIIETLFKKPHPEPYRQAHAYLEQSLGHHLLYPWEILMAGDSLSTDIAGANALGMMTCYVDYRVLFSGQKDRLISKRLGRAFDAHLMRRMHLAFPASQPNL